MDVLIIGGGIGGLALAAALHHQGLAPRVHERTAAYKPAGAALMIWPNGLRALRRLHLADAVVAAGWPVVTSNIRTARGRLLSRCPVADISRATGLPTIAIRRAPLQSLLAQRVPAHALRMADPLHHLDQSPSRVTATFADGSTDAADLCIGADGLRSRVRAHVTGSDDPPRHVGHVIWRGIVPFHHPDLHAGHAQEFWGRGQRFGVAQVDADHVSWYAALPRRDAPPAGADPIPLLRARFAAWADPVPALIEFAPAHPIIRTDIYDRPALRAWTRGRVALLGDAAHPMTPDLGQGACTALEDAIALADALAHEPGDLSRALARYELARRPRAAAIAARSHRFAKLAQLRPAPLCWARDAVTSLIPERSLRRSLLGLIAA